MSEEVHWVTRPVRLYKLIYYGDNNLFGRIPNLDDLLSPLIICLNEL